MDLDSAYIEPLLDDWLEDIQAIIKEQVHFVETNEFYMPFIAIPTSVVSIIFKITEYFDLGPETKYVAVDLYDKFMCNYFWEVYKTLSQSESCWFEICKKISRESKLYLMSCLQLASKMDSRSKGLEISQILNVLQWIDTKSEYTHNVIFVSEYKVFKMIGFKMPICTPLNCVEVLLAATGLKDTPNIQNVTTTLLDLAFLQRKKLYSHLQYFICGHVASTYQEKLQLMTVQSNVLFLAASVVLCGTFFSSIDNETVKVVTSKLSECTNIETSNICDMTNILLTMAIQE